MNRTSLNPALENFQRPSVQTRWIRYEKCFHGATGSGTAGIQATRLKCHLGASCVGCFSMSPLYFFGCCSCCAVLFATDSTKIPFSVIKSERIEMEIEIMHRTPSLVVSKKNCFIGFSFHGFVSHFGLLAKPINWLKLDSMIRNRHRRFKTSGYLRPSVDLMAAFCADLK